jgi:anti-anti-sigma factor
MKYEILDEGGKAVLSLREQLTFTDRSSFDGLIPQLLRSAKTVVVDLKNLDYMDSAGLGMLLTLRDKADKAGTSVVLRQPKGDVKELLKLSCFDTLFTID